MRYACFAQGQLTQIDRRAVREDIAPRHHVTRLHDRALVDAGVLVGSLVLGEVINIDRRIVDAHFFGIDPHHNAACINGVDYTAPRCHLANT